MAEDNEDPREVEWHPRKARNLLGHLEAEQRMRQAFESGKLHHAWLISGPKGIGKATLAYRFAGFALAGRRFHLRTIWASIRNRARRIGWRHARIPTCSFSSAGGTARPRN